MKTKKIVRTRDRPTGKLHIGHYVESLVSRLKLQEAFETNLVFIAALQALTDNFDNPEKVRTNKIVCQVDQLMTVFVYL